MERESDFKTHNQTRNFKINSSVNIRGKNTHIY